MIFSIVSLMLPGKLLDLALLPSYLYLYLESWTSKCTQGHIDDIMQVFNVNSLLFNSLYIFKVQRGDPPPLPLQAISHVNNSTFPQTKAFLVMTVVVFYWCFLFLFIKVLYLSKCSMDCTVNFNCVSGTSHIMSSFGPSWTLKNQANLVLFVLSDATAKKTCSQLWRRVLSGSETVAFAITCQR